MGFLLCDRFLIIYIVIAIYSYSLYVHSPVIHVDKQCAALRPTFLTVYYSILLTLSTWVELQQANDVLCMTSTVH